MLPPPRLSGRSSMTLKITQLREKTRPFTARQTGTLLARPGLVYLKRVILERVTPIISMVWRLTYVQMVWTRIRTNRELRYFMRPKQTPVVRAHLQNRRTEFLSFLPLVDETISTTGYMFSETLTTYLRRISIPGKARFMQPARIQQLPSTFPASLRAPHICFTGKTISHLRYRRLQTPRRFAILARQTKFSS